MTPGGEAPGRDPAEQSDPSFFTEGAPNVIIGGLTVGRSIIHQVDETPDKVDEKPQWLIYGTATGAKETASPPLIMFGDLTLRKRNWVLSVTVVAMMDFKEREEWLGAEQSDSREAVKVLAPWATHVMYDAAATAARGLLAGIPSAPLEVPYATPDMTVELDS